MWYDGVVRDVLVGDGPLMPQESIYIVQNEHAEDGVTIEPSVPEWVRRKMTDPWVLTEAESKRWEEIVARRQPRRAEPLPIEYNPLPGEPDEPY